MSDPLEDLNDTIRWFKETVVERRIPETTTISARPVWRRHLQRMYGFPLDPPTEEEKQDAIKVLSFIPVYRRANKRWVGSAFERAERVTDLLQQEAERIHEESTIR